MRKTVIAVLLSCCAVAACGAVEADPTFLVVGVEDSTYDLNVTAGRPEGMAADNWHRSQVAKTEFASEVQEGDHVICHLAETDRVRVTGCRKA